MKARNAAILAIIAIAVIVASLYMFFDFSVPVVTMGLQNTTIGEVLTDDSNMTLYTFSLDSPGNSTCDGECAQEWPPFVVNGDSQLAVPSNASGGIGAIMRSDEYQITYNGLPLYRYSGDSEPGDISGDNLTSFNGTWSAAIIEPQ
jgi:predicted lipoprotein with Yx(FWY)xxD motif